MPTIEELTRMKEKIDADKVEQARLEGSLADRQKRLKELGFASEQDAEAELDKIHDKLAALDEQVQRGVEELRTEYSL